MFEQLPDDIVLEIVSHLRIAHDVARLASSCKHLHRLLSEDGWRTFVRTCFPLVSLPLGEKKHAEWAELAKSLTRQARAWDTKAFQTIAYTDDRPRDGNYFTGYSNAARPFHPVIDARLTFDKSWEVVSWGAGEDVVGRFRPLNSRGESDAWFRMEGKAKGYEAGMGDVTAIHLTEPNGKLGLLVGRANSDLSLVSAAPGSAGKTLSNFKMPKPVGSLEATTWISIGSIDTLPNQSSVAVGNRATVSLFPLEKEEGEEEEEEEDAGRDAAQTLPLDSLTFERTQFVHSVKALNNDTVVCALASDPNPLRYLTITPTGFTPDLASKNPALLASRGIDPDRKLTVRAIHPIRASPSAVRGSSHSNLLLSAWDDGTCRLLDVRTPSPYDALYRDMYQPFETVSSLAAYGADRFVAGSNELEALKVFDFRWPKSYYHSAALPCWSGTPFPDPLKGVSSRPLSLMGVGCDHVRGRSCVWHEYSRRDYYRPNFRFHVMPFRGARSSTSRIFSLAKASDISDSFYVGLAGAVAELSCAFGDEVEQQEQQRRQHQQQHHSYQRQQDEGQDVVAPAVASAARKRDWRARTAQFSFAETGDGLLHPGVSMSTFTPRLVQRFGDELGVPQYRSWHAGSLPKTSAWHRWDQSFWRPTHFTF